jgi:hypothetical protein
LRIRFLPPRADRNLAASVSGAEPGHGFRGSTLKAVTFVDERAAHPYPLSGLAIRVVDYTVVSTGKQTETTTVHKRVVMTFNGTADVPISFGDYGCILHLDTHKVDGCNQTG